MKVNPTRRLRGCRLALLILTWTGALGRANDLPAFASDAAADGWLRAHSAFYQAMAEDLDHRGGYGFRRGEQPAGVEIYEKGRRFIELNDDLKGPKRVSIMIFELTNAYQEAKHWAVDWQVYRGTMTNPAEFALWCEVIEYDGLRLHRRVLEELERAQAGMPEGMWNWLQPGVTDFGRYQIPLAYDFVAGQRQPGGLRDRYRQLYLHYLEEKKRQEGK